jgi:hypothetical protein
MGHLVGKDIFRQLGKKIDGLETRTPARKRMASRDIESLFLPPSLTLGCGTDGGNYLGNNINNKDLLSIKTVAKRIVDYERDE